LLLLLPSRLNVLSKHHGAGEAVFYDGEREGPQGGARLAAAKERPWETPKARSDSGGGPSRARARSSDSRRHLQQPRWSFFLRQGLSRSGRLRLLSFFAKKARGEMAAWIIRNRITAPSRLKEFDVDGYEFNVDVSTATKLVFQRRLK
jgi:hypothetical protein